jgi:hypothetical protein
LLLGDFRAQEFPEDDLEAALALAPLFSANIPSRRLL